MELFYNNVKRVVNKGRSRTVKGWVVTYCDSEWAGAWYKKEADAWKFADYLKAKDEQVKTN